MFAAGHRLKATQPFVTRLPAEYGWTELCFGSGTRGPGKLFVLCQCKLNVISILCCCFGGRNQLHVPVFNLVAT